MSPGIGLLVVRKPSRRLLPLESDSPLPCGCQSVSSGDVAMFSLSGVGSPEMSLRQSRSGAGRCGRSRLSSVSSLLDAAEIAQRCGVTRAWVYAHAAELGALRLGAGPRPRLRFDPAIVDVALRTGFTNEQRRQSRRRA